MPSSDMDVERPKSREEILTTNTDDFIIGDRVWVNGTKPGYIQYLGETQFSPGDWAGVVLDDHSGKNDGSVAGVRYFQCEPKRGVFARLHKLTRYPLLHAMNPSSKLSDSSTTPPPMQRCLTPTRTPSPGSRNIREGDRVQVASSSGPYKTGILRYLGQTDFAAGEWAGIELDEPLGKNDGTVAGKRYFRCSPNYGLFSPAHKVSRVSGSLDRHRRTHNVPSTSRFVFPERNLAEQTAFSLSPGFGPSSLSLVQDGDCGPLCLTRRCPGCSQEELERELSVKVSTTPNEKNEHHRYAEESEKRALRLRQLLEAAEAERKDLATKLEEERKKVEELEFRIEEECIGKDDLEMEREKERRRIEELERRLEQEVRKNEMISGGATPDSILKEETKRLNEEMESLREKLRQSDEKIKELQMAKQAPTAPSSYPRADELTRKEEALLQAQLTLDNKKREVQNLLDRITELEKELEKSKARQSRQLDAIDELNMKLQKSESKRESLAEELHTTKEKIEDMDRRLRSSSERISSLEKEKHRLEQQLLKPESTPEEQALLARLQDREKETSEWRKEAELARSEADRMREDRDRTKKELEDKIRTLNEAHQEEWRKEKKKTTESADASSSKIRELERTLSEVRADLESARSEAETRLSRQEARLQEAELKAENLDRLRDQMSRLQAEKDLMRVEKEETLKRLQTSEDARARWEAEAARATEEVNLLKSQVQHLRTEFTTHREDLVKKLAETKFDAQMVQDLHFEIEEQRRVVETMQERLKNTEGERDQLQSALSSKQEDQVQVENTLRQEVETLKRRLCESESDRQSIKRSLEAAQLLVEEKTASQQHQQSQILEKIEIEKLKLEKKVNELQAELAIVKNGRSDPDEESENLKVDKDALEQQVHFLNSVIVDMQHKNDDLRSRLEILETEVIFDGHLNLGLGHNRSTTRLFCDICDLFDLHDTEDCPKQSVRRTLSYSSQESEF